MQGLYSKMSSKQGNESHVHRRVEIGNEVMVGQEFVRIGAGC